MSIQQKISENIAADKAEKYRLWHHHRHNQLTTIKNIKTITSQAHEQNESVAFKDKSRKEIHQNPSRIYFALVRKKSEKNHRWKNTWNCEMTNYIEEKKHFARLFCKYWIKRGFFHNIKTHLDDTLKRHPTQTKKTFTRSTTTERFVCRLYIFSQKMNRKKDIKKTKKDLFLHLYLWINFFLILHLLW